MAKAEDLTGRIFGHLKVLHRAEDRIAPSGQKRIYWNCECLLCGDHKDIGAQNLKTGKTISCGCYQAYNGKMKRNRKICVECGKTFECPPSENTVTCSAECRILHTQRQKTGRILSESTRLKISEKAKGRDMTDLQKLGVSAAMQSPKSGRFETNINAIDWHLISPNGEHYYFHSLHFWLRKNCRKLFGCEPDSREFRNIRSGISGAKRAMLGKISPGQRPCCTYKGWRVIPTEADESG